MLDRAGDVAEAVKHGAIHAVEAVKEAVTGKASPGQSHLSTYLALVSTSEDDLVDALDRITQRHATEPDMSPLLRLLGSWSRKNREALQPMIERHGLTHPQEPASLSAALFGGDRSGGFGLLRDLHDLWLLANESHISWEVLGQATKALRDEELEAICQQGRTFNNRLIAWLRTRIDAAAPQVLIVPV